MALVSTLALAPILGHLVPRGILACLGGKAPSSRPNEIQRAAASSQCRRWPMSSTTIALRQQASACLRKNSALLGDMPNSTAAVPRRYKCESPCKAAHFAQWDSGDRGDRANNLR